MKSILVAILAGILSLALVGGSAKAVGAAGFPTKDDLKTVPRMRKEELKPMLGNPDVIIIDVRIKSHWNKSKVKIPGAFRENPIGNIKSWEDKYPKDKTIVIY